MIATTIEQSRSLLELGLDPKSADMTWIKYDKGGEFQLTTEPSQKECWDWWPAWSLSALLEVMPKGTELIKMCNDAGEFYYEIDYMFTGFEDSDPVTTAYEMACWLLESGYIKKGDKNG